MNHCPHSPEEAHEPVVHGLPYVYCRLCKRVINLEMKPAQAQSLNIEVLQPKDVETVKRSGLFSFLLHGVQRSR